MNKNIVLTATETIQLAAILPSFFVFFYLLALARNYSAIIVPVLYFFSLCCSFLLPILAIFPELEGRLIRGFLTFNEHLAPELGFLLIVQLVLRKTPSWQFWLILALPLIGGGPLLYLYLTDHDACFSSGNCVPSEKLMVLYRIIGSALIFMLLVFFVTRRMTPFSHLDETRRHKYWLIIILIVYNILVSITDLLAISDAMNLEKAVFLKTMTDVAFFYLTITSIFRVFNKNFGIAEVGDGLTVRDKRIAAGIKQMLENDKPYREMGFSRGMMSDKFALTEQHLSRIINTVFKKSFTDLMNEYRVREAKELLGKSELQVTQISHDVGFNSIATFNRVFKNSTNMSPRDYRNFTRNAANQGKNGTH